MQRSGPFLPQVWPRPTKRADLDDWRSRLLGYLPEEAAAPADSALERVVWQALVRRAEAEVEELPSVKVVPAAVVDHSCPTALSPLATARESLLPLDEAALFGAAIH